jgi:hypothetical protein
MAPLLPGFSLGSRQHGRYDQADVCSAENPDDHAPKKLMFHADLLVAKSLKLFIKIHAFFI